jgi:hypothetical protein
MACGLCPGYFSVWYLKDVGEGSPDFQWIQISNIDSWTLDANVQEATKKRTSSTNGLAVKFCEDIVDYTASVTTTVCETDWLWCHILSDSGNKNQMSDTREGWWFFGWGKDGTSPEAPDGWTTMEIAAWEVWRAGGAEAGPHQDSGVFVYGKVVPGGIGGDNTATDPTTATFTINVSFGPILPEVNASCDLVAPE